jgi:hypothetical protein
VLRSEKKVCNENVADSPAAWRLAGLGYAAGAKKQYFSDKVSFQAT